MSSGEGGGCLTAAVKDLIFVILILVALFALWIYTGGPNNPNSKKPFIKPISPFGGGEVYGPSDK